MVTSLGPVGEAEVTATSSSAASSVKIQVAAGAPANLVNTRESDQVAMAGEMLPEPVSILVTDEDGNPVRGVAVDFYLTASAGQITPQRTVTTVDGLAQTLWTLGSRAGQQLLSGQIKDLPDANISIAALATAGPVASLAATRSATAAAAGDSLAFRVQARDAFKNPIAGLEIAWTAESGSMAAPTTPTDASGTATGEWSSAQAGATIIRATAVGLESLPTEWRIEVVAGTPAIVTAKSATEQIGVPGALAAEPPLIQITDAKGNPIAGVPVTFTVVEGTGQLAGDAAVTDADGVATASSWRWGPESTQSVEATAAGLPALRFTARVEAPLPPKRRR